MSRHEHTAARSRARTGPQPGAAERSSRPDHAAVLGLQRSAGNRAVRALIAREVTWQQASATLSSIMSDHGREDWYKAGWTSGEVRRIAEQIAAQPGVTKENLRSRLQGHEAVRPLIRPHRMALELHEAKTLGANEEPALHEVYAAYKRLLFYHASKAATGVRTGGLDPDFGGKAGGLADTRSLANKRAENVAASKGKAFVTRKWSEAKQYLGNEPGEVIRLLIPVQQQALLQVDPDSQYGLYIMSGQFRELLKGVDRPGRDLSWWAYAYLANELSLEARSRLPELYARLMALNLFPAGSAEPTLDLTQIPQPGTAGGDALARGRMDELKAAGVPQ
jgi:hypothetical protein